MKSRAVQLAVLETDVLCDDRVFIYGERVMVPEYAYSENLRSFSHL
jgi:hypothetical protein